MFRKNKETYDIIPETIIGKNATIVATEITGDNLKLRIDGTYKGIIKGINEGFLMVGPDGVIEGAIEIGTAIIAGKIIGNIHCKQLIHLAPEAVVHGDITSTSIIIDQGASINGMCKVYTT